MHKNDNSTNSKCIIYMYAYILLQMNMIEQLGEVAYLDLLVNDQL